MEEQVIKKLHWYDKFPRWLKIVLFIVSVITMVYWVCFMTYKILCAIRVIGAFVFEKRNYWTFLCCILILVLGGLLLAQYYFKLDPFGKIVEQVSNLFNQIRGSVADLIKGS